MVHRVQVFEDGVDIDIVKTYITDTNDLFCLVYQDKKFYLFMIDLDSTSVKENIESGEREDGIQQ